MRHYKKGRKLGTDASHTKAMKKSLIAALFENDRIKTIEERAKEIRPEVDRVITWAKRGDVHSRRLAIAKVGDQEIVRELFAKVEQGMFADRPGGYTRIIKLGPRKGDKASMVIMELVTEPVMKKGAKAADAKPAKKVAAKKAADKAEEAEVVEAEVVEDAAADDEVIEATVVEDAPEVEEAAEEAAEAEPVAEEAAEPVAEEAAEEAAEAADEKAE